MEKFKNKFEIILGFATIIISLSAFKDELSIITINLGYIEIRFSDYFLIVVCALSISLYLYVFENIVRDTRIGNWRIFEFMLKTAYFIFILTIVSPIFILLNIIAYKVALFISTNLKEVDKYLVIINNILQTISIIISAIVARLAIKDKRRRHKEELTIEEITELDSAQKLYSDGYFGQSILESFKVLETHLYKKLTDLEIRVSKNRFRDLIKFSLENNIITENDIPVIEDIRGMRNAAAHTDAIYTEKHAAIALNFIKELIKR